MTTQRRTATAFVNRTFTNATPARNTTLIRVHARIVPKMRTAAVLTRAGTLTATAGAESFARTGNTGTGRSVSLRSVHAKHLPIASAGTIVLTIPADRDAILTHNAVMEKVAYPENAKALVTSLLRVQIQNILYVLLTERTDTFACAILRPARPDIGAKIYFHMIIHRTLLILVFVYLKYVQRTVIVIMEKHVYQDLANE